MGRNRNAQLSLEAAKTLLRNSGMRCTAARVAVVQSLADSQTPLSPAEVVDDLAEFGFDKSTIYRSLTELDEADLVTRLDLGEAVRRFELRLTDEGGPADHPHYMCVDCGKILCLSGFRVELIPEKGKPKPPGEITQVLLKGHCDSCR